VNTIWMPFLSPSAWYFSFFPFPIFHTTELLEELYLIPHLLSLHEPTSVFISSLNCFWYVHLWLTCFQIQWSFSPTSTWCANSIG
jgi:hypothetical protein